MWTHAQTFDKMLLEGKGSDMRTMNCVCAAFFLLVSGCSTTGKNDWWIPEEYAKANAWTPPKPDKKYERWKSAANPTYVPVVPTYQPVYTEPQCP
jgi:hypothetical protein